jgi:hypothetical protein
MRCSPGWRLIGFLTACREAVRRSAPALAGALLFLAPAAAFGQGGTVVGRVTDAGTSNPVAAASIVVDGSTLGAAPASDGRYRIVNLPADTHVLVA